MKAWAIFGAQGAHRDLGLVGYRWRHDGGRRRGSGLVVPDSDLLAEGLNSVTKDPILYLREVGAIASTARQVKLYQNSANTAIG
jgi:hypothetical protein